MLSEMIAFDENHCVAGIDDIVSLAIVIFGSSAPIQTLNKSPVCF